MSQSFLLSCVQLHSSNDLDANLDRCRHWIRESVRRGADLILLPEDYAFLATHEEEKLKLTLDDLENIKESIREEAIRYNVYILAGGHPTISDDPVKLHNTSTLFSPLGEELGHYHKIHLFDAAPPGAVPLKESERVEPGEVICLAETPLCKIGFSICYDLRFPELYRNLALAGAELITIPAAFTLTTGKDHWRPLLQARAIENQCYVAAPAQWGRHSETRFSFGQSMICDPWGTPLACAAEGEGIAVAVFDPNRLNEVRENLPSLRHIRHDLFGLETEFEKE